MRPTPVLALCLAVCACKSRAPDVPLPPMAVMGARTDDAARVANYPAIDQQTHAAFAAAPPGPVLKTRPLNALVLSGGGQYSAYAAGLLTGWRETGRPEFDAICGISSGSLLAVIAYAGPNHDDLMRRVFTTVTRRDLFRYQPAELFRSKSVATAEPMRQLIETEVNAAFIEDMRVAHRAGRRLFVGTMNENTRRLVVWDLGAIACSGRPDADCVVRRIVLASAAIPGLIPAVAFDVVVDGVRYQERHVDGGATAESFLRLPPDAPRPDPANPAAKWLVGSNLFVIAGGKLFADPYPELPTLKDRTVGVISGTLHGLHRSDLWRMYAYCVASGMRFNQQYIPADFPIPAISTAFDPPSMRRMYDLGLATGRAGVPWRTTPPGADPGEEELPRAGFTFTTE